MGRAPAAGLLSPAPDSRELLGVAEAVARAAGALLLEHAAGPARDVRAKSTPTDLVSAADLAAERLIRDELTARRPGDAILGEEGGDQSAAGAATGLRWVVDPLDGTINFLFGIPQWCVSLACEDEHGALIGVVLDPARDELFAAQRDGAATLDGIALDVAAEPRELSDSLVATGFAYDAAVREGQAAVVARLLPRVRDVRRFGSAALDLAWTAAGRCDAYYERGVKPWDVAAGALICARTGLEVTELVPGGGMPGGLLAAPAELTAPLRELVS